MLCYTLTIVINNVVLDFSQTFFFEFFINYIKNDVINENVHFFLINS
jgi:hypothetical protein